MSDHTDDSPVQTIPSERTTNMAPSLNDMNAVIGSRGAKAVIILATLVAVYSGLAFFGVNLPVPVWAHQFQKLQNEVNQHGVQLAGSAVYSLDRRINAFKYEALKFKQRGAPVPPFISNEISKLTKERERTDAVEKAYRKRIEGQNGGSLWGVK